MTFDLTVNDVVKQVGRLADLIHDVPSLIEVVQRGMRLLPGDVLFAGTPSGVGLWREPAECLRPGGRLSIPSSQLCTLAIEMT